MDALAISMEPGAVVGVSITVILISALFMERFRLPMVLGVLIAGTMIGPSSPIKGLSIGPIDMKDVVINDPTLVGVFALIGSALILFGIGLEYSIVKISEFGLATFLAALIKIGIIYIMGYSLGIWLGFSQPASVLLGLLLSFSSTPIIVKILEGHGKIRRPEVPFIVAVLILEDLIAVFLLGIMAGSGISEENNLMLALFKVILTFVFAYLLLSKIIAWLLSLVSKSDELLVLFVVSLVLMIGYATQGIGLGFSVGAFLAGSIVAGTEAARRVEEIIRPFNTVFASFFFFSIGMLVDFGTTFSNFVPLIGILIVAVAGKFMASGIASYLSGFSGRSASFAGAALLPLSELSLVVGASAAAAGIISPALVGMLAFVVILTSLLSVLLIGSEGRVYQLAEDSVPTLLTRQLRFARSTSIGVQKAVQENSRYSAVIGKLPTIGGNGWGARSSHEQIYQSLRNVAAYGGAAVVLFLMERLATSPQFSNALGQIMLFIVLGFYAIATMFLTNSATAFSTYAQIMRRSGRSSLYSAVQIAALAYFIGACALVLLLAVSSGNSTHLVLLMPAGVLGACFLFDIVKGGRVWLARLR